jgi:hypothetical protein
MIDCQSIFQNIEVIEIGRRTAKLPLFYVIVTKVSFSRFLPLTALSKRSYLWGNGRFSVVNFFLFNFYDGYLFTAVLYVLKHMRK